MHTVPNVKRTTINLDQDLVRDAAEVLGTARMTDTIHAAMSEIVRRRRLEEVTKLEFPDLTLEGIKEMRKPRTFDHLRD